MARPNVADIDGKAVLGRDLAERVHIVDEGGEEHKPPLRLQQIKFYCREIDQRSGIANGDVPITNGLPLEGEWAIYPSGDAGQEVEPTDSSNELETLIILSMESEDPGGGGILHVHLGNRADASRGQADASRCWMDTLIVSDSAETAVMSDGEGAETYLTTGDVKRVVDTTDGVRIHADGSTGHGEAQSIRTDVDTPENRAETVSKPRKKDKPPDSPSQSARTPPDKPDGCGNHPNTSSVYTDTHSIGNEMETSENETEIISKRQKRIKPPNSPETLENETYKPIG